MEFSDYIRDLKESKNIHQSHYEQMALEGISSLRRAIEIAQDLRNKMYGNSEIGRSSYISIKYDGSPAIIFGINPLNRKWFVSTKAVFSKSNFVVESEKDLEHYEGDLREKMRVAFFELRNIVNEGVWQADLMYTNSSLSRTKINEEEYITFRPNTITYAIKSNSDLAKQISASKIGVVIHTKYIGEDFNNMTAEYDNIDLSKKSTKACVIFSPKVEDLTGTLNFSKLEYEKVTELLSIIGKNFNKLDKEFYQDFRNNIYDYFERFVNSQIREGKFVDDNFILEFEKWLDEYYKKHYFEKLQEKGRKTRSIELAIKKTWLQNNKNRVNALVKIYITLSEIKKIFIEKFNSIKRSTEHYIETENGFKIVNPEGYCVIDEDGIIKFVDRLEFSKNNFTIAKKWK